jgi:hypothetical protein
VRLLIQKLWKTAWDQLDHRNDVLHGQENMVSQAEADMMNSQIRDFFAIGSQGFLSQDRYYTFSQVILGAHPFFGLSDRIRHG